MQYAQLVRFAPWRWPQTLRFTAYGVAVAILLYLCLAPEYDLPKVTLWDKAEHASAWFVLAATGLALWPERPRPIALFAIALGGVVEVLQAALPLGRDGDWRDWVADILGVATAIALGLLLVRLAGRRAQPA